MKKLLLLQIAILFYTLTYAQTKRQILIDLQEYVETAVINASYPNQPKMLHQLIDEYFFTYNFKALPPTDTLLTYEKDVRCICSYPRFNYRYCYGSNNSFRHRRSFFCTATQVFQVRIGHEYHNLSVSTDVEYYYRKSNRWRAKPLYAVDEFDFHKYLFISYYGDEVGFSPALQKKVDQYNADRRRNTRKIQVTELEF